jgi:hypothetical protein
MQEFDRAVEQLDHSAYSLLPGDDIRRKAGKELADGVEDLAITIQLQLERGKTVSYALRQALELQAVLLAARPHKTSSRTYWGSRSPHTGRRDTRTAACWRCEEPGHFRGSYPYGKEEVNDDWRQKRDRHS